MYVQIRWHTVTKVAKLAEVTVFMGSIMLPFSKTACPELCTCVIPGS